MPIYRIEFKPSARRALERLPKDRFQQVFDQIKALADSPRPPGVETLAGADRLLRIRVGDQRVIYQVEDDRLLILVVRVAHRREAYRQLARLRGR